MPSITLADISNTRLDSSDDVEVAAADWLDGNGVTIYSNGNSSTNNSGNNYLTINGSSVLSGEKWQCVELVNRLYLSRGWITSTWYGNGNQLYANAPTSLNKQVNGSIAGLKSGDVIGFDNADGVGHAAIIESMTGTSVSIANQNTTAVYSSATFTNGTMSMSGWAGYNVQGIVHSPSLSDGSFIQTPGGSIYELAGGSPFYVPNWNEVGGPKSYTIVTQAVYAGMPKYPNNGTYFSVYGSSSIYKSGGGAGFYIPSWNEVGGSHPYTALPATGVSQKIRQYPIDGTYFTVYGSPTAYESGGGAGFYIPNWNEVGGPKTTTSLPATGVSMTIKQYPDNNMYMTVYGSPTVYVTAGGAGLVITSWAAIGGQQTVSPALPATGVSNTMRSYPLDNTYVKSYATSGIYKVYGGATSHLYSWGSTPPQPTVTVDDWAIRNQLHATD